MYAPARRSAQPLAVPDSAGQAERLDRTTAPYTGARELPLYLRVPNRVAPLRLGAPDDPTEREADALAERLMRGDGAKSPSPPDAGGVAGSQPSSGQPLYPSVRAFFEPRLRRDLSAVRVHTGPDAAASARAIGADAYSAGRDIVFDRDAFQPGTPSGLRLLAHELAHFVLRKPGDAVVRRQMRPASAADHRDMVRETIRFLQGTVDFLQLRGVARLDRATFDRLINSWYAMAVQGERSIDDVLGGDAALRAELRDAYLAVIRLLMSQAATAFSRPVGDLYNENSGRIPLWAWKIPHEAAPGISTPVPMGQTPDASGAVNFASNGVNIVVLPDTTSSDSAMTNRAETSLRSSPLPAIPYSWRTVSGRRVVSSFTAPGPVTLTIRTTYGPGVSAASRSGYGRGTTAEDVAGARVTPHSSTLGFHEGSHGVDFIAFIRDNPPPVFGGAVGMTEAAFNASVQAWHTAWINYVGRATAFSERRTDCVGATTIDDSNRAAAGVGATVTLVCTP